jgi:HK97 family phage portal protein
VARLGPRTRAFLGLNTRALGDSVNELIPSRPWQSNPGSVQVTAEVASRHSGVWAAQRLRANLISSMPIYIDKRSYTTGVMQRMPLPPVMVNPYGPDDPNGTLAEWLWATQYDLDRFGNCFGIIRARNGFGLPAIIELCDNSEVRLHVSGGQILWYHYRGIKYTPDEVWHERQYRVPGLAIGMSPLMYAAWSISGYLSAHKFALDFFGAGGLPNGILKNTARASLTDEQRTAVARRFVQSTANRAPFVASAEWEWTPAMATDATAQYLEEMKWGTTDIARFFDVPGDLIDAAQSGAHITYANVGQRNVQLLTMSLAPAVLRRETALSKLVPNTWQVRFDTDEILRMDVETREKVLVGRVTGRTLAPDEARAMSGLPPFTEEQMLQLERLLPTKPIIPKVATSP